MRLVEFRRPHSLCCEQEQCSSNWGLRDVIEFIAWSSYRYTDRTVIFSHGITPSEACVSRVLLKPKTCIIRPSDISVTWCSVRVQLKKSDSWISLYSFLFFRSSSFPNRMQRFGAASVTILRWKEEVAPTQLGLSVPGQLKLTPKEGSTDERAVSLCVLVSGRCCCSSWADFSLFSGFVFVWREAGSLLCQKSCNLSLFPLHSIHFHIYVLYIYMAKLSL